MFSFLRKHGSNGASNALLMATGSYILLLSLFGGGNSVFGWRSLLLMGATAMFAASALILTGRRFPSLSPAAVIGLGLLLLIPLIQIVPLPPALWQALPGQALRTEVLSLMGAADTWQPLSVTPIYTAYTFVMAAGFVALVIALMALDARSFDYMPILLIALIATGIIVGVAQVSTRGAFPRFYENADIGSLIGFFTNKNHMALAIAASLPLVRIALIPSRRKISLIRRMLFFAYWATAIIAIIATSSRAGLAIGFLASLLLALSLRKGAGDWKKLLAALGILIAIAIAVTRTELFRSFIARFDYIGNDYRWAFVSQTWPIVQENWTVGTGGGSFVDVFMVSERLEWVKPTFVNHVHNDYIEIVLEYGVAGVVALTFLVAATLQSAWRLRRSPSSSTKGRVWAGCVILLLIALHSVVDYPIRRPAFLAILAVSLALVWRPEERVAGRRRGQGARPGVAPQPVFLGRVGS